jgi:hypothetical protein
VTIVPSSIIVSRAGGVLCTRSRFPSSIRGRKYENRGKRRERERNELTSQTRCVDERKFVWFVGKKKLRHRSTPTEKKMRNHEVRDLGRQLYGFLSRNRRCCWELQGEMSASERCYFSPLAVGVTIACVIPDKKMKKEKFFWNPQDKNWGIEYSILWTHPIYINGP